MTRTSFWVRGGAVIVALAALGCSADLPSGESTGQGAELRSAGGADLQDALLSKVGRGLAVALADPTMRTWIRSRIDASPYVEWRIPFRDVLLEEAGRPEVRRVSESAQLTAAERGKQKALPPLELYFPIPQHRTAWQAGEPVQVAVRIGHSERYTVYGMDGRSSVTRGDHIPPVATLVLAESEIDYTDRESAIRGGSLTGPGMLLAQARRAGPGAMALPPPEEPPPPPPPTGGVNTTRHTRLGYFRTTRYHDDVFGGRDEVEIFGLLSGGGGYARCTWRTDVRPNTDYYMDLANAFTTISTAVPWGTGTLYLRAFEDDDDRCVVRSSDDRYGDTSIRIDNYGIILGTSNPGDIAVRVHSVIP
jgi:hypothetical protein